jgi:hypothetical protein
MKSKRREATLDRRQFLSTTGGGLLAAAAPDVAGLADIVEVEDPRPYRNTEGKSGPKRKIPIGAFDPVYENLSLDEMLDRVSELGLEAMEIGTGGPSSHQGCSQRNSMRDRRFMELSVLPLE